VAASALWTDALAMKDYQLSPSAWYALPRADRLHMIATSRADRIIQVMMQHDMAEKRKKDAEWERKKKGKH